MGCGNSVDTDSPQAKAEIPEYINKMNREIGSHKIHQKHEIECYSLAKQIEGIKADPKKGAKALISEDGAELLGNLSYLCYDGEGNGKVPKSEFTAMIAYACTWGGKGVSFDFMTVDDLETSVR